MPMTSWFYGIKNLVKSRFNKVIAIVSPDQKLADAVAFAVASYFQDKGKSVKFVEKESSMFSKALRLMKTTKGITIYRSSKVLMEIARDMQNYGELLKGITSPHLFIMSYSSLVFGMEALASEYIIRRKMIKKALRYGPVSPNHIFMLQVDPSALFNGRKKYDDKHKVEDSYKGASFLRRAALENDMAEHLNANGIPTMLIDARSAKIENIATVIIKSLEGQIGPEFNKPEEPKEDIPQQ